MENMERDRLVTRLRGAKYASQEEAIILCTLASEEITRLDHDCRVLYGLLMRQEKASCPCREQAMREVCS